MKVFRLNLDPTLLNFITLGIIIIFIAGAWVSNQIHNDSTNQILQENRAAEEKQGVEVKARSEAATEERQIMISLSEDIKRILEAQGNLSQQNREGLVRAINTTYYETIPAIEENLQVIRDAAPESNFTAQKLATERIENITHDIAQILENQGKLLNASR